MKKLASHLKPSGELLMATQNAPILKRVPWIEPPPRGHLRRWVDRKELRALLESYFVIEELRTISPSGETGALRIVNSRKVARLAAAMIGANSWRYIRERLGIGWTSMVRAKKL